jgi:hypothetical protein
MPSPLQDIKDYSYGEMAALVKKLGGQQAADTIIKERAIFGKLLNLNHVGGHSNYWIVSASLRLCCDDLLMTFMNQRLVSPCVDEVESLIRHETLRWGGAAAAVSPLLKILRGNYSGASLFVLGNKSPDRFNVELYVLDAINPLSHDQQDREGSFVYGTNTPFLVKTY